MQNSFAPALQRAPYQSVLNSSWKLIRPIRATASRLVRARAETHIVMKDGSDGGNGHAEHLKEAGNAAAEDLERGTGGRGAIGSGSSTGNAQGQDSQQAFQHHGAVTDLEHVFLVLNGLGRSAGGNQAVETGNSAAGNGDKQDGEHGRPSFSLLKPVKTGRFMVG